MALKCAGSRLYQLLTRSTPSVTVYCQHAFKRNVLVPASCYSVRQWSNQSQFASRYFSTIPETTGNGQSDEALYSLVNVKVKGNDEAVLKSYTQFVARAANLLNLDISGRILLPTRRERYTLLKSPHIYKKHRAQYEIRTHGRLLQLRNLTSDTASVFLEYIQRNLPEGVSMSVEQTANEAMPDYLKPPQAALDFLKSQEPTETEQTHA